ncbi:polygalacturonase 1 beta-like protein 3 [Carica papaya]|uniref:polygalacturonase 1 beta-like protein 3 n=1 Tax=Carica papaya TaxID=3649 RepID=UPI000B8CAB82|nr:polygalacturonase 1 beta-like protein 3 [Carica papaya]
MSKPLFFFSLFFLSSLNINLAGGRRLSVNLSAEENPFTPKAFVVRYWNKEIHINFPISSFLLSKVSPLNVVDSATFTKLAAQNKLSTQLPAFCSLANLFCFPDLSSSLQKHNSDSNFAKYIQKDFNNYGNGRPGGVDSFKNYSDNENVVIDSFRRYSRNSVGHDDRFSNYAPSTNVPDQSFNTYGTGATVGSSEFKNYQPDTNVPNSRFSGYSGDSNGRAQSFKVYSQISNAGSQIFSSYGRNGNGVPNTFTSYSPGTNVVGSGFSGYGQNGNEGSDNFTSYGFQSNLMVNVFNNYGSGGNSGVETFSSYVEQTNLADDNFTSYAKNSNDEKVNFATYANTGVDNFISYGQGADKPKVGFKTYGSRTSFKSYSKIGLSFKRYNVSSAPTMAAGNGKSVKRWVEPGKFFRESMLKKGTVMEMPDIEDKMPKRSFLPRSILSKIPFSTSKLSELKQIFNAADNSSMENIITDALRECERGPSPGETKRCVGSGEDLIDFATSMLGRNIMIRTTQNIKGSKQQIMIGSVKGINGGKVTKSVSCHQSLYPYLIYYCHSVPKVRVYEAEILDPNSKEKINQGVAICHLDTSQWSPSHGAFMALGSGPGHIEVCHWIFENDLTWTVAAN